MSRVGQGRQGTIQGGTGNKISLGQDVAGQGNKTKYQLFLPGQDRTTRKDKKGQNKAEQGQMN